MNDNISIGRKIWMFPLTRIVVGFIVCFVVMYMGIALLGAILRVRPGVAMEQDLVLNIWGSILIVVAYILLYRAYESRKVTELSTRQLGRNLGIGLALGAGLLSLVMLIMYLAGSMTILGLNPASYMLAALALSISSGVVEEILFRGVVFRIMEEWLGTYWSLVISGIIFGLIHMDNKDSTTTGIAVVVLAGMLLAAAYMYTRSLWLVIAFHFSWNFAQGGIFGAKVSGLEMSDGGLLNTRFSGEELITGGNFGPEASIQAVIFLLVTFLAFMLINKHNGQILLPSWKRRRQEVVVDETELPISS